MAALGFVLQSIAEYSFLSRLTRTGGAFDFIAYQHLTDAALFLEAAGVLVAGAAWSWIQITRSSSAGGASRLRTGAGIALALFGAGIFAAWALIWALGTEYQLAGGAAFLPSWSVAAWGLFEGLGLALWAVGWFLVRWDPN